MSDINFSSTDLAAKASAEALNTTHRTSNGSDHTYIDQDVTTTGTPTFASVTMTNTVNEFSIDGTLAGNSDSAVPSEKAVKTYVDAAVVGLYDHKGAYNASTNSPDLDTSPSGVKKGDAYTVSVAGTFFTEALEAGDVIIADQDDPTQLSHWTRVNKNIDAATTTTKGIVELATDGENAANVVVQGNDSRLSDARTPTAHAASHTDGTDDIQNATNAQKGLATAAQITDLEANTTHRSSDGSDHTFINQSVTTSAKPSFAGVTLTAAADFKRAATATNKTSAAETLIGVTDTSVARTITLATADVVAGRVIMVKDESGAAGTNNITVDTEGAETIDGQASLAISANYGVLRVYSDGTNWFSF